MKKLIAIWCAAWCWGGVSAAEPAAESWTEPATGMVFLSIAKGCYQMGAQAPITAFPDPFWERVGHLPRLTDDEMPRHEVCVDAFWIGKHEVRVAEWRKLMGGEKGGSSDASDGNVPVAAVTWAQARQFAERLGQASGQRFRLPTEAEWEYACRAGAKDDEIAYSRELVGRAWYGRGEARQPSPRPVGQLKANAFGLHDVLGNVWEWTEDSYSPGGYQQHTLFNPVVRDAAAPQKVMRGGSIRTEPRQTRCGARGHLAAEQRLDTVGFRLVRER